MSIEKNKLPQNWKVKKLGDICDLQNGYAFKSTEYVDKSNTLIFRMSQIRPGGILDLNHNSKYLPDTFVEKYKDYLIKDGDVLIAMTDMASETKILGLPTYFKSDGRNFLLNQRVGKLFDINSNDIDVKFLRYILSSPDIIQYYKSFGKGALQINLGKSDILNAKIPIPPIEDQQGIVCKIEELFSALDKAIENLHMAQKQLETYRQTVLKWAFEGRLTNKNLKKGELPKDWQIIRIGDICKSIVPNRDKPKTFTGNIKWVTTPNLKDKSIRLDYENIKLGLSEDEIKNYNARVIPINAVIMTCVGTFGLSAIVEKRIVINQQLHAFVTNEKIDAKLLAYCIQFNKRYFESKSTSTTIQYLNKENCNSMPFPLCSIGEQNKIVQEIEGRLSVADNLEESITQSLQQAEALRQSILKKAFEGQLL